MANRIFVCGVIALWLSSMTWLVADRILPSLTGAGQPPFVKAYENGEAVAWEVQWQGAKVGTAASVRLDGEGGSTDLFNRVVLEEFPVMQLAPAWIRAAIGNLGSMSFDVMTRVEFDPLGNFSAFKSRVSINDMDSILSMAGRMEGSVLELKVQSNDFTHTTEVPLLPSEALSEALFPDSRLLHMYEGQTWQKKVYSPFSSPTNPVELVQVEVTSKETIEHQGDIRTVMRVEYKSITSTGVPLNSRIQGISWVDPTSGEVLRRDVMVGNSKLRFERLDQEAATATGLELFKDKLIEADTTEIEKAHRNKRS